MSTVSQEARIRDIAIEFLEDWDMHEFLATLDDSNEEYERLLKIYSEVMGVDIARLDHEIREVAQRIVLADRLRGTREFRGR